MLWTQLRWQQAGGKFPTSLLPSNGNGSLPRQALLLEVVWALSGDDYLHLVLLISSPKICPMGPSIVVAVQPWVSLKPFYCWEDAGEWISLVGHCRSHVTQIYESVLFTLASVTGLFLPPSAPFPASFSCFLTAGWLAAPPVGRMGKRSKSELYNSWKRLGSCEVLSIIWFEIEGWLLI